MKNYEKISETKFKVSEVKELSSEIDVIEQMQMMSNQLSNVRKFVSQCQDMKVKTIQIIDRYNTRVEIINEAKEKVGLATKELVKVELPKEFDMETLDLSILPNIDISRDEENKKD